MKRILIQDTLSISVSTINNKKVVEVITNGKGMIFSSENTGIAVDEMEKEIIDFIDNVPESPIVNKAEIVVEEKKEEKKDVVVKPKSSKAKSATKENEAVDLFKAEQEVVQEESGTTVEEVKKEDVIVPKEEEGW
jgi:hypothetical protein